MTVGIAERDLGHAVEAAVRLPGVAGGLRVRLEGRDAVLEGPGRADALLRRWRVALLNERLLSEANAGRHALLAELVA